MKKLMFAVAMAAAMTASADWELNVPKGYENGTAYVYAAGAAGGRVQGFVNYMEAGLNTKTTFSAFDDEGWLYAFGTPSQSGPWHAQNKIDVLKEAVISGSDSGNFFVVLTKDKNADYAEYTVIDNWATGGSHPAKVEYTANIPEPTSALLMLLGMAGLALRRKQA